MTGESPKGRPASARDKDEGSLETDEEEEDDQGLREDGAIVANKLMQVPPDFEKAMVHQVSDNDS